MEYIVIPQSEAPNGRLVFQAEAVLDMQPFHEMVPLPKPKMRLLAGGKTEVDPDDKFYAAATKQYGERRFDYIIINSLKNTEGLEWDKVKYTDPSTWGLYEEEFKAAGLNPTEIQIIIHGILVANSLNDAKLQEARDSFLASLAEAQVALSSQVDGHMITPCGKRVSA